MHVFTKNSWTTKKNLTPMEIHLLWDVYKLRDLDEWIANGYAWTGNK